MHAKPSLISSKQRTWLRGFLARRLKSTFLVPAIGAGLMMGGSAWAADITPQAYNIPSGTTDITDSITGNGTVFKYGDGTLVLSGDNSFVGNLSGINHIGAFLVDGTLSLANDNALGNAANFLNAYHGTTVDYDVSGGDRTIGNNIWLDNLTNPDDSYVELHVKGGGGIATQAGIISGPAANQGFTKTGLGTLVLSGTNTYGGGTNLWGGTLRIENNSALGTGDLTVGEVIGSPLTLDYGNVSINNNIHLSSVNQDSSLTVNVESASATQNGIISDDTSNGHSGSIVKTGDGRLILTGDNTYSGGTDLRDGKLQLNHNNALGTGTLYANGGGLEYYLDGINTGNDIILNDNLQIFVNDNISATESGVISGSDAILKTGGGQLTLSGANTYDGGTRLNNGTLRVENDNALGSGALTVDNNANQKTLDYQSGRNIGNAIVLNGNVDLNVDSGTATQAGAISDGVDGSRGITKTGDGTLILEGYNTYTGDTDVDAGTLQNDGTIGGGLGGGSNVTANTGATFVNNGTVINGADGATTADGGVVENNNDIFGNAAAINGGEFSNNPGAVITGDGFASENSQFINNSGTITGSYTGTDTSTFYSNGNVENGIAIQDDARMLVTSNPLNATGSQNSMGDVVLTDSGSTLIGGEHLTGNNDPWITNIHTGDVTLEDADTHLWVGSDVIDNTVNDFFGGILGENIYNALNGDVVNNAGTVTVGNDTINSNVNASGLLGIFIGNNSITNAVNGTVNLGGNAVLNVGGGVIDNTNSAGVLAGALGSNNISNTVNSVIAGSGATLNVGGGIINNTNSAGAIAGAIGSNNISNTVNSVVAGSGSVVNLGGDSIVNNNVGGILAIGANEISNTIGDLTITGGSINMGGGSISGTSSRANVISNTINIATIKGSNIGVVGGTISGTDAFGNTIINTLEQANISGSNVTILGGNIAGTNASFNTITNNIDPIVSGPGFLNIFGGSISGDGNNNNANVNNFIGDVNTDNVFLGFGAISGNGAYNDSIANNITGTVTATGNVILGGDDLATISGYNNSISNTTGDVLSAGAVFLGNQNITGHANGGSLADANVLSNTTGNINAYGAVSLQGGAITGSVNTYNSLINTVGDVTTFGAVGLGGGSISGNGNANNSIQNIAGTIDTDSTVVVGFGAITGAGAVGNEFLNETGNINADGNVVLGYDSVQGAGAVQNSFANTVGTIDTFGSVLLGHSAITVNGVSENSFTNTADAVDAYGDLTLGLDAIGSSGVAVNGTQGNHFTNQINGTANADKVLLADGNIDGNGNAGNSFLNSITGTVTSASTVSLYSGAITGVGNSGNTFANEVGDINAQDAVAAGGSLITGDGNDGNSFTNIAGSVSTYGTVTLGYNGIAGNGNSGNSFDTTIGAVSTTGDLVLGLNGVVGNGNQGNSFSNATGDVTNADNVFLGGDKIQGEGNGSGNTFSNSTGDISAIDTVTLLGGSVAGNGNANNFLTNAVGNVNTNGAVALGGAQINGNGNTQNTLINTAESIDTNSSVTLGYQGITGIGNTSNIIANISGAITAVGDIQLAGNTIDGIDASANVVGNAVIGDISSATGTVGLVNNSISGNVASGNIAGNLVFGNVNALHDINVGGNTITGDSTDSNFAGNVIIGNVTSSAGTIGLVNNAVTGTAATANTAGNIVLGDVSALYDVNVGGNTITGDITDSNNAVNVVMGDISSNSGSVGLVNNIISGIAATGNIAANIVGGDVLAETDVVLGGNKIDGENADSNQASNFVGGDITSQVGSVKLIDNTIIGQNATGNQASNQVAGDVSSAADILLYNSNISGDGNNNNTISNTIGGGVTSADNVLLGNGQISGNNANNNSIINDIAGAVDATGLVRLGVLDSISGDGVNNNSIFNSVGAVTKADAVVLGGGAISGNNAQDNSIHNTVNGQVRVKDGYIGLIGGDISALTGNANRNQVVNRVTGNVIANGSTLVEFSNSVANDGSGNFVRNVINRNLTQNDDSLLSVTGNDNRVNGNTGVTMNGHSYGNIGGLLDITGSGFTLDNSLSVPNGIVNINDDAFFGIGSGNTVTNDGAGINTINNTLNSPNGVVVDGAGTALFGIGSLNAVAGDHNHLYNDSNGPLDVLGGKGAAIGVGTIVDGSNNILINQQNGDANLANAGSVISVGGASVTGDSNYLTNNINGNVTASAGSFLLGTDEGDINGNDNILNNNIYADVLGNGNLSLSGSGVAHIGGATGDVNGDHNQILNTVWGTTDVNGTGIVLGNGSQGFTGDNNLLGNLLKGAVTVDNGWAAVNGGSDSVDGSGNHILNRVESTFDATGSLLSVDAGSLLSSPASTNNTQENVFDGAVTLTNSQFDLTGDTSNLDERVAGNTVQNVFNQSISLIGSVGHVTGDHNFAEAGVTVGDGTSTWGSLQIDGRGVNDDLQNLVNSLDGNVTLANAYSNLLVGTDTLYANDIDGDGNHVTNVLNGNVDVGSGTVLIGAVPGWGSLPHNIVGDNNIVDNTINGQLTNLQVYGQVLLTGGDYAIDGIGNTITNTLDQSLNLINGNSLRLLGGNLNSTSGGDNVINNVVTGNVQVGASGNSNNNWLQMEGGHVNGTTSASDGNGNAVNNIIAGEVNVYDGGIMTVNGENNYVVGGVTAGDPGHVFVGNNDVTQTINNELIAHTNATAGGHVHIGETAGTQQITANGATVNNTITSGTNPLPPGQFLNGKVAVTDGGILTLGSGIYAGAGNGNTITNILGDGTGAKQLQTVTGNSIVQLGGGDYAGVSGTGNTVHNTLDQGLQITDSTLNFAGAISAGTGNVTVQNTITDSVAANGTTAVNFFGSNGDNVTNTIGGHLSLNDSSTLFAQDGSAAGGGNVVAGYINLNGDKGVIVGNQDLTANSDNSLDAKIHFRNSDAYVAIGDSGAHSDGTVTNTHYGIIDTTVPGEGGLVQLSGTVDNSAGNAVSITNTQNGNVTLDGVNSTVLLTGVATGGGSGDSEINNNIAGDVDVTDGKVLLLNGTFAGTGSNALTNTITGNVDLHSTGYLLFNGDTDAGDLNTISNNITGIATLNDATDTLVKGANNSIDGGLVLNTTTSTELNPLPGDGTNEHNDITTAIIGGGDTADAGTGDVLNELTVGGGGVVINANPNTSAQRAGDRGYDIDSGHLYVGAFGSSNTADGQNITNQLNGNVTLNGGANQVNGYSTGGGMIVVGAADNDLTNGGTVTNEIIGAVDLNGGSRLHLGGDQFTGDANASNSVTNRINGAVTVNDNSFIAMWGENDTRLHNEIDGALELNGNALFHAEGVDNAVTGGTTLKDTAITQLGGSGGGHAPVSNIASDFVLNNNSQLLMGATSEFAANNAAIVNHIQGSVELNYSANANESATLKVLSGGTGGLHSAVGSSSISGTLSFDSDSTYGVNINQQTATGVQVGGTATLGDATVQLSNLDPNGLFNFGREYNILNANTVNGEFSGVDTIGLSPAIKAWLTYPNSNDVNLQMLTQFSNNSQLPGTINQQNFAEYLDKQAPAGVQNGVNSDLNDLLNLLAQQTGQTGDLVPLNSYLGDTYAAFDTAGYWNANRFANRVATHALQSRDTDWVQSFALNGSEGLAGVGSQMSLVKQLTQARPAFGFVSTNTQVVDYDDGNSSATVRNGLWADVAGDWLNNDGDFHLGSPDWKLSRKSVLLGYQGGSQKFTWGVVGGYHDGNMSFDNRNASGDQEGWDLGLNGLWQNDSGTYVNGVLAYNKDSNDLKRNDGMGTNTADFGSHTLSAMLEVGKRIKREHNITFTPYASLLGVKYDRNGVQESGSGVGLNVDDASHSYLTSNLGVRVGKDYLDKTGSKRGGVMLGLSWMHQFSSTDFPVTASLQSAMPGTGSYRVYGTPLSSNSIGVQLGGYGRLSKDVLGFLNYNGNFSSNQKVHSITAGVEYQF